MTFNLKPQFRVHLGLHHCQAIYTDPKGAPYVIAQFDHPEGERTPRMEFCVVALAGSAQRALPTPSLYGYSLRKALDASSAVLDLQACARYGARVCSPKVFSGKVLRGECLG